MAAGSIIKYMFADDEGKWHRGKVLALNADGVTADVMFDDGEPFHRLPVWGDLHGGRLKIVSGGVVVDRAVHGLQRTLLPSVKADINALIC